MKTRIRRPAPWLTAAIIAISFTAALAASAAARQAADAPPAPPLGLPAVQWPADNRYSKSKADLGRLLYFDKRLSSDGTVACATCHDPAYAFSKPIPVAIGIKGLKETRNAPTDVNRAYSQVMQNPQLPPDSSGPALGATPEFWDGRAANLEEQSKGPIANPMEMTLDHTPQAAYAACVGRLKAVGGYRQRFRQVFGTEDFTIDQIARAIATFERTVYSGNSPWDRYMAGDKNAMTPSQVNGWDLFKKKKCDSCHIQGSFTDNRFANIGVGMDGANPDLGRYLITKNDADRGAFKTPSLREVEHTAPYMHDGSMKTLEDVIKHYDQGGTPNPWLDQRIVPLKLKPEEKVDLVNFMKALSGEGWQAIKAPAPLP
jgi:cytochrome c peroxidase